jgi:hypothetical protein
LRCSVRRRLDATEEMRARMFDHAARRQHAMRARYDDCIIQKA